VAMVTADEIARAAALLRAGGLVAFPTETVYGVGADAANEDAMRRLFAAKGRPTDHPVIVHLADAAQLSEWARTVPEAARVLAAAFWPGPLTLIVPRAAGVLDIVTGGQDTVGVRVPSHPVAHALLVAFGGGIAAPSANRFGHISPTRAAHVRTEFDEATVPLVLDGDPPEIGVESTIVDVSGPYPTLLRPGGITLAQLAAVLGEPVADPTAGSPRAPGTLARHYAPHTPLEIVSAKELPRRVAVLLRQSNVGAVLLRTVLIGKPAYQGTAQTLATATLPLDAAGYAHNLYQYLRALDDEASAIHAPRILVEDVPSGDEWLAVRDRLRRAAQSS